MAVVFFRLEAAGPQRGPIMAYSSTAERSWNYVVDVEGLPDDDLWSVTVFASYP